LCHVIIAENDSLFIFLGGALGESGEADGLAGRWRLLLVAKQPARRRSLHGANDAACKDQGAEQTQKPFRVLFKQIGLVRIS
jgi:hypothetical protein